MTLRGGQTKTFFSPQTVFCEPLLVVIPVICSHMYLTTNLLLDCKLIEGRAVTYLPLSSEGEADVTLTGL